MPVVDRPWKNWYARTVWGDVLGQINHRKQSSRYFQAPIILRWSSLSILAKIQSEPIHMRFNCTKSNCRWFTWKTNLYRLCVNSCCTVKDPHCWGIINNMNKAPTVRAFMEEAFLCVCVVCEARPPRVEPHCMQTTLIFYYRRHSKIKHLSAV